MQAPLFNPVEVLADVENWDMKLLVLLPVNPQGSGVSDRSSIAKSTGQPVYAGPDVMWKKKLRKMEPDLDGLKQAFRSNNIARFCSSLSFAHFFHKRSQVTRFENHGFKT
jgi:hypothetical protein